MEHTYPDPPPTLFLSHPHAISNYIVPYILDLGIRDPLEAVQYIKDIDEGVTNYFNIGQQKVKQDGLLQTYTRHLDSLYQEKHYSKPYSKLHNQPMFKPQNTMAGIFQISLNDNLSLVGLPDAVSRDGTTVLIVDNYITTPLTEKQTTNCEQKIQALMAIWRATDGIYYINYTEEQIITSFDEHQWNDTLLELESWANLVLPNN